MLSEHVYDLAPFSILDQRAVSQSPSKWVSGQGFYSFRHSRTKGCVEELGSDWSSCWKLLTTLLLWLEFHYRMLGFLEKVLTDFALHGLPW